VRRRTFTRRRLDSPDPAPASLNRPTVSLTERGARLLALLHCREILPSSSTTVAAVLDRRINGILEDVSVD